MKELAFLAALRDATRGSYDCFALAGPAQAAARQRILALVQGPTPKAKAGINVLQAKLFAITKPPKDCIAVMERNAKATADRMLDATEYAEYARIVAEMDGAP